MNKYERQPEYILDLHGYTTREAEEKLVEIIELRGHPFFVGTQFHPELKSRPLEPHPLFLGFIKAASEIQNDPV